MKYFGTDGIRGVYGHKITEDLCFNLGCALGSFFGGLCVLGRDTRVSGLSLSTALTEGIISTGGNVLDIGIVPTPAVALLCSIYNASCGVMVSASHNSGEYNGIKVFDRGGLKLNADKEILIENAIDTVKAGSIRGTKSILQDGAEQYISHTIKGKGRLDGLRVLLDCGYGSSSYIARQTLSDLGASVTAINEGHDGTYINKGNGALFIDDLSTREPCDSYDLCFAFDGDADRMACYCKGKVIDGDSILYSLSKQRTLKDNVVVGTVMSNLALEAALRADGKALKRTPVGDKYILDLMVKSDYSLGGEQSGHYIFYPESLTGDGLLAAIYLSQAYTQNTLTQLKLIPQQTVSVSASRHVLDDIKLKRLIDECEMRLESLLVRPSGTEPKIRITAQGGLAEVNSSIKRISELITEIENNYKG